LTDDHAMLARRASGDDAAPWRRGSRRSHRRPDV